MKIKKALSVLAVSLWAAFIFAFTCGCGEYFMGYVMTDLETAYERGYITQEDLKSIAYYYNNDPESLGYDHENGPTQPDVKPIPKQKLSKKTERELKLTYIIEAHLKESHPDVTVKNVEVFYYYGTYNNYAVAFMQDNIQTHCLSYWDEKEIGGVTFYNYFVLLVFDLKS